MQIFGDKWAIKYCSSPIICVNKLFIHLPKFCTYFWSYKYENKNFIRSFQNITNLIRQCFKMKKTIIGIIILLISNLGIVAQTIEFESIKNQLINLGEVTKNNEDYSNYSALKELLKDVEIVMLGEQSHGEATTYQTKIKLIKYLHEELGYDLLVFEAGFYDCHKAWELIEQGEDIRTSMGRSINDIWSATKDLIPLAEYLKETKDKGNELKLLGFDSQFIGKLSFISDLAEYLKIVDKEILMTNDWKRLKENFEHVAKVEIKKLKRNEPKLDTIFLNHLIEILNKTPSDYQSNFWVQTLKNLKVFLSDMAFGTAGRDQQMAANLIWLKEKYPESKIICWGATDHFLYNSSGIRMKNPIIQLIGGNYYKKHPMMGHYVKEHYSEKVYTIGFTAFQGSYGLDYTKKIKPAKEGTLEFLLSQSDDDNLLLPLKKGTFKHYKSRPLGNYYMKNDIGEVMDAVIFNRYMTCPKNDYNFYLTIYPENKKIQRFAKKDQKDN